MGSSTDSASGKPDFLVESAAMGTRVLQFDAKVAPTTLQGFDAVAESMATVTVDDPRTVFSERDQQLLQRVAERKAAEATAGAGRPVVSWMDEILQKNAAKELLYATCPCCERRNPAGVRERATAHRRARVIGSVASLSFATAIWLLPWMALVVLAMLVVMTTVIVLAALRTRTLTWRWLAPTAAFPVAMVAILYFYPRAAALWPLVLGGRFALAPADEDRWTAAKSLIRFEQPYR